MRIRKRSVALISSSTPTTGKPDAANSTSHGDDEKVERKNEGEEFLLPLVAAVMDVQAKAEAQTQISGLSTPQKALMGHGISEIGKRRGRNWRDALLRFGADSDEVKGEDKSDYRGDMIMSGNPEDKFKRVEYKAAKPSSVNEEMVLTESGLRAQDLAMGSVEKKSASVNGGRNVELGVRSKETIFKNSKPNIKIKTENYYGGSQCKRRNGRGWRCSQRTLVGYSLCEHHLGKSRFKHINCSEGSLGANNNKGSKFKELHLVHDASPNVEIR